MELKEDERGVEEIAAEFRKCDEGGMKVTGNAG